MDAHDFSGGIHGAATVLGITGGAISKVPRHDSRTPPLTTARPAAVPDLTGRLVTEGNWLLFPSTRRSRRSGRETAPAGDGNVRRITSAFC